MSALLRFLGLERRMNWPHTTFARLQDSASPTGRNITAQNAIASAGVWACVRVISESLATLPLSVYHRLPVRGRERLPLHPIAHLLHDAPNPRQTAVEFREQMVANLLLYGNSYTLLERFPSGRVRYLYPLAPDKVTVKAVDDASALPSLVYLYQSGNGQQTVYVADDVMHVRGLSFDGLMGVSPITLHRETVANEQAEREFTGRFFGNNARPGGVLKVPGKLTAEAAARLKGTWETAHRGLDTAHRVAVLEEGIEFQSMSMPLTDAQFIEQRRFSLEEIARIFRVPPHLVGDLTRATYSNVEQQSIDFVTHCVRPWAVRIEQAMNASLFYPGERENYYVEHLLDALLRADTAARYSSYAVGRQWGWLSVNDIRERENLSVVDGGDQYLVPMNMTDALQVAPPVAAPAVRELPLLADNADDVIDVEQRDIDAELRIAAPAFLRANARRGLAWYADGKAGDGVTEQTVREARAMAAGTVSDAKAIRMGAWFRRHMGDLNAPAADPDSPDYPSPGVVAHALWGGGNKASSARAMRWAERQANADPAMGSSYASAEPVGAGLRGDVEAIARAVVRGLDVATLLRNVTDAIGDEDAEQPEHDPTS